ncbi:hypothetical protein ACSBR1_036218 [Camellia fascicularis]
MFLLLFFKPLSIAFETLQALLGAIVKRIKGFIRLKIALGALYGALPDATPKEIKAYDDECAICREPIAKAKRLSCKHLFHLTCLRSCMIYVACYNLGHPIMSTEEFEARKANLWRKHSTESIAAKMFRLVFDKPVASPSELLKKLRTYSDEGMPGRSRLGRKGKFWF